MFTSIKRIKYAAASLLLLLISLGGAVQPAYANNGHGYAYGHSKHTETESTSLVKGTATTLTASVANIASTQSQQNVPGDNGDIKTHNLNTPVTDQRDEPKVCGFYLDAFNFDNQQSVDWKIVNDTHGSTALSGAITLISGNGRTADLSLPNGMYKVYWNFNGEHGSAKHKVFKVDCEAEQPETNKAPVVTVKSNTCVMEGQKSGSLSVTVTNPNNKTLTYLVSVDSKARAVTLVAGASQTVTFTDLAAGTYTVNVYENGHQEAVVSTKVETCPPAPVGRGGGQVLGESTQATKPASLANTGESTLLSTLMATLLVLSASLVLNRKSKQNRINEITL